MPHTPIRTTLLAFSVLALSTACNQARSGDVAASLASTAVSAATSPSIPAPKRDIPLASKHGNATAVFAGGCFWGVEAVFEQLKGVKHAESGYVGGSAANASYDIVSGGRTGHAESVRVVYDPSVISYGRLLQVFFSVAHDPTQKNRQGPDVGSQYRSALFYATPEQQAIANDYIAQLEKAGTYGKPIATELTPLKRFFPAEAYHQDYMRRNPNQPYIVAHDRPKLQALSRQFPTWVKGG